MFEANWSTTILLAICFFLACGETNFSRNVKNIPNIMSWIEDALCCRRRFKLLLIFLRCGSFQTCNICKKFWKIVKAFVYYSFAVMSLFKIYFFLPGMILARDEKELTLMKALKMLHKIFPERAFYGNAGPSVIMTDNCDELRNALQKRFPDSCLLLCIFHILQQVWCWLYDQLHNIRADDRVEIMKNFRQILYCETEVELQKMCDQFLNSNLIKKYGNALIYFSDLFLSKQEWAVCYRNNSLLRGPNTNNFVEAQFLVIKYSILRHQRQFNVNMLLDELFSEFEEHFKIKLFSLADGTFDGVYSKCFTGF